MGEFKVHRVRFFDYMPAGIRAMAFNTFTERLAVARTDASVEIFNRADNFYQEKVIPGRENRLTEALVWIGERLFSAGLNGEITEYDVDGQCVKYTLDAYGGPLWCIAASAQGTHLAVGCEDGTVKLFLVLEGKIRFERNLDRQKGRIISVSWHPSGEMIAAGMLDMIRVFSVETGHPVHRLLVDRTPGGLRSREGVVWAVVFLSDSTIISGDSSGRLQVWDGRTGTLVKSHQITKWDVLALSVSQEEDSIVAGTSEGTVVQFQFLNTVQGQEGKEWIRTRTFKNHTHDVRAIAEIQTAYVSGGMDTQLVVRPFLEKYEHKSKASALLKIHFPHRRLVSCAKKAGLLLFQYPTHLELWRLGDSDGDGRAGCSLMVTQKPEKLLQLKAKGDDHISCSVVSPCGEWIAFSTATSVRLYKLQCDGNNISITKISKLPKALSAANQLCFSPDSTHLFAASAHSSVHVISLSQSGCKLVNTLRSSSGFSECVSLLTVSADAKWLAAANTAREVHVYNLTKQKVHCTVPVYSSGVSAMAINPSTNNLVMVHADHQIFEYSIKDKKYSDWSRELQRRGLHPIWLGRDTPVTNVTFNPHNPAHIILHDMYMLCIIDQSLPLPDKTMQFLNQLTLRSLPAELRPAHTHAFKVCKSFRDLLYVELMEDQSLVLVERPLVNITTQLPAPVRQKKFAT